MCLSLAFIVVDILSVTSVLETGSINPFWKFSFVFKCFTDTIILDDFKTALDRIMQHKNAQFRRAASPDSKAEPIVEELEYNTPFELRRIDSGGSSRLSAGVCRD